MYTSFDYVRRIVPQTETAFGHSGPAPWWYAGSTFDLDFVNNRYHSAASGDILISDALSISRASVGYFQNSDGTLTKFNNDTFRLSSGIGLLIEGQVTNTVQWNRDLTNVVWTATNITPAKDQTGPDGVANSASSITATAGNGTILQAVTGVSATRFQTAYIKRITGTGTINMTMDNGATWTAVTVTSSWTRVSIPTQTLTNPTVGFRIVTSGDAVAIDFVQLDPGTRATSPIEVGDVLAIRATDVISAIGNFNTALGTLPNSVLMNMQAYIIGSTNFPCLLGGASGRPIFYRVNDDTILGYATTGGGPNTTLGNALTFQDGVKCAFSQDGTPACSVVGGGGAVANSANSQVDTQYDVGSNSTGGANTFDGYYRRLTVWNTRLSDTALQTLTAP